MLRLTLLRLPRSHLHSRAQHAIISATLQSSNGSRYNSTSSKPPEDPVKPAEPISLAESNTSPQTASAQSLEADKQDSTSTIYIAPSTSTDFAQRDEVKEPEPEKPDAPRGPSGSQTPQTVAGIDVEDLKQKLRTWSENAAIAIRERTDKYTHSAIKTFAQLGRELNKVTGYGEIETLKRQVAEQEARIKTARSRAREAKHELEKAEHQRSKSQREVNDLLTRKSTWTDDDVVRFTALVRQDHLYEQAETEAKAQAIHTEDEVEREFTELMRVILNRYHEEQIWSDKIRSASTYGSLTVIGLNMLIFLLAIIVVEPWKRRRLAQTFERKVEEMSTETINAFEAKSQELSTQLQNQQQTLSQLVEVVTYSLQPGTTTPLPSVEVLVEPPLPTEYPEEGKTAPKVVQRAVSRLASPDPELAVTVAATAAIAGIVGWVIGHWLGP
ncbi:hypothetical protein EIP86_008593 [Pleurotus ostreatoroseus]|nr:hypothetical protein EIP86_008593 [Pleurotus ostreatoroseus]